MTTENQNANICTINGSTQTVEMPQNDCSLSLSSDMPVVLNFTSDDIQTITVNGDAMILTFLDGQTMTIENFSTLANNNAAVKFSDGEAFDVSSFAGTDFDTSVADIQPAAGEEFTNIISKPTDAAQNKTYDVQAGQAYVADFNKADVQNVARNENGDLVLTFKDGTQTVLVNFVSVEDAQDIPQMTLADGSVISLTDLLTVSLETEVEEEVAIIEENPEQNTAEIDIVEVAQIQPRAGDIATELAAIEPAAGDAGTGAGPLSGSNNFGSSVLPIGLDPALAIGPIDPTELAFDLPEVDSTPLFVGPNDPDAPTFGVDQVRGYEDTPINFGVTASPSEDDNYIVVQVSDIPNGWTPDNTDPTTAQGTYDPATGTWTITLAPNQSLPSSPVFIPPANSDVDITPVTVLVTQYDSDNSVTGTAGGSFDVIVDAVADDINLNANDVVGQEDQSIPLDISASLQDVDGTEEITEVIITNLPDGFTLNVGTDLGNGEWSVPYSELNNVELSAPQDYSGTLTLGVTVVNAEVNVSDVEFDLTNNVNVTRTDFDVTITPVADKPELIVNEPRVKEDGTTELTIAANLKDTDGSEYLEITVENLDASWTVETGANNGTYNAATGTWTIVVPAGQNYSGGLTLTPPADSDVDMNNVQVTATAVEPNGDRASSQETVDVIVDAVVDTPILDGQDISGDSGMSYPLNISNAVTDTDGSETLGPVTIAGLPSGFTLSAGNEVSPGVWEVAQADLAGLELNAPNTYEGTFDLTLSVTATDNPTDVEFDPTDNETTVTDTITVDLNFNDQPPKVTFGGADGAAEGTAEVYEDGSVFAPITATLQGNTPQQLTVTVTGIDSSWTVETGSNNGTYNASTGTWTITLPENTNYNGGLTFTPPANSDVDMDDLVVTASARNTANNEVETASTDGEVIVDAVADMPDLDADIQNVVNAGQAADIDVSAALTDLDGSEELSVVTISGVPNGFSLNKGTEVSDGTYEIAANDLDGLQLNTPAGYNGGNVTLNVSVTSTEQVTDEDFDFTNNQATATDQITVCVYPVGEPPVVTFGGADGAAEGTAEVYEDGSVFAPITATLNGNADQVLTVTVTGIDSSWTVETGSNNGTYNASTGTWTITLPENTNYNGGLTFTPPANSDVDMDDLVVTASARNTANNEVETASTDGEVIVDAVADMPDLDADIQNVVNAGQAADIDVSAALTDLDGSEELSVVTISGVPNGFSLNKGTEVSDGTYEIAANDLDGLQLNTPAGYNGGNVTLNVSVTSTEQVTDEDFDFTNNQATATDQITVCVYPVGEPPVVTFGGADGAAQGEARVYEDGTVFAPITAALRGNGDQVLTVTVTGIDSSWTVETGSNNGTYNASTGTWTITLPENTNYDGGLTFTPPADSDVDMDDLVVTASARNTANNEVETASTDGEVIVDAVADMPNLDGADDLILANYGSSVDLDITASLNDTDGSEELSAVTISGLPEGYTLSAGTEVSPGVWEVEKADLEGLQLNIPDNAPQPITAVLDPSASLAGQTKIENNGITLEAFDRSTGEPREFTWVKIGDFDGGLGVKGQGTDKIFRNEEVSITFDNAVDKVEIDIGDVGSNNVNGGIDYQVYLEGQTDPVYIEFQLPSTVPANGEATFTLSSEDFNGAKIEKVVGYSVNGEGQYPMASHTIVDVRTTTVTPECNIELGLSVTATEQVTDEDFDFTNNEATKEDTITLCVKACECGGPEDEPPYVGFGPNGSGSAQVLEDGSVFVPIVATLSGVTSQQLTVSLEGIDSDWTIQTGANNGSYNASTGTWTITLPENTNYDGGLTFTPPADSDVDLTGLTVRATAINTETNYEIATVADGQVIVDAVADMPDLDADIENTVTAGQAADIDVSAALTDIDGSEELSVVTISGVPNGFSLNKGTEVSNGTYEIAANDLDNLRLNTPANYDGGYVTLKVSVTSTEQVTDVDFNFDNNEATATDDITVCVNAAGETPEVTFGANGSGSAQVLEDGSVFVPITATLNGNADQVLTVSVKGIDSDWTIQTGANNGSYNASIGTWTITLPENTNYDGGLRFTPPADSDVDLTGLTVTATSETVATGNELSATTDGQVIVDAVADMPDLDADIENIVYAGQAADIDVSAALTDIDGSEELSVVTISGVPNGFSLNKGTEVSNGTYEVAVNDLNGLQLNTPAGYNGGYVTLKVSVTSTEQVTDVDFNFDNNEATATDEITVCVYPVGEQPEVTFGANGSGSAQVLEDGSVFVPITATLNGNADQVLTVSVKGIDSDWTIQTGANNGSYNASTGTWTITLPENTNYDGGLRFTPPADSDVDLTGLTVTATARNVEIGQVKSSSTDGQVIVDAVADKPDVDAGNDKSVDAGSSVALNISTALNDTDGSESLGPVRISGVPNGYSLSAGNENGNGVWIVSRSDLDNLRLNTPQNGSGNISLTVSVTSTERVTDGEFINDNNQAPNSDVVNINVKADDKPDIDDMDSPISKEENLTTPNVITGNFTADFGSDGNGAEFCIPQNGKFSASGAVGGSSLTSGGVPVTVNVTSDGKTYIGKAGGEEAFRLTVNTDGSYRFVQKMPLDHQSATNPNEIINLNFDICAEDNDGDMDVATFTVRVKDTGPIAKDDSVTLYSCDFATMGNVINNYNQDFNGKDQLSVEGPNTVKSVTFEGKTYDMPENGSKAMVVEGDHGALYMHENGSYSYVTWENQPQARHSEAFSYTLVDGDGDESTATLNIKYVVAKETDNDAADYGNQLEGPNFQIGGDAAYKTGIKDGAMIFGWTDNDVLVGNNGDDALYGYEGNDTLYGGKGNDVLNGEAGENTLYGGEGADIFAIFPDKANNSKYDTIKDFNLDEGDSIAINDLLTGFDAANDDIADFVRIVDHGNGKMLQVNSDGQGNDFANAAKIEGHADLDLDMLDAYDMYAKGQIEMG